MHSLHRLIAVSSRRILASVAPLGTASLRRNASSFAAARLLQLSLAAASPRTLRLMCTASEAHFHKVADETLDALHDRLSALEDQLDDVEVTIAVTVLSNAGCRQACSVASTVMQISMLIAWFLLATGCSKEF